MNEPLDELYMRWLYRQVASEHKRSLLRSYWKLMRKLYTTEFVWFIANDDNRVEDGKALRTMFLDAEGVDADIVDAEWLEIGCSFLEMLVALSHRLYFDTNTPARDWFWHMLTNLGLAMSNDKNPMEDDEIDEILASVVFRTYEANGQGGLFPLRNPESDQREIEIWYQLSAYLGEME